MILIVIYAFVPDSTSCSLGSIKLNSLFLCRLDEIEFSSVWNEGEVVLTQIKEIAHREANLLRLSLLLLNPGIGFITKTTKNYSKLVWIIYLCDSDKNLHGFLLFVVFCRQLSNFLIFVLSNNLVAVQVLLLLGDSPINDSNFFLFIRLLFDQILSLSLSESCSLLGVLVLSLHVVILFLQLLDLLRMIRCILCLFLGKLFHVLLQLHNWTNDLAVFLGRRLRLISCGLPSLLCTLETNLNECVFVFAFSKGQMVHLKVCCTKLAQVKVSLAQNAVGFVTGND